MNEKWNPRLSLRNWLMRPSLAESMKIEGTALSDHVRSAPHFSVDVRGGRVSGISLGPTDCASEGR